MEVSFHGSFHELPRKMQIVQVALYRAPRVKSLRKKKVHPLPYHMSRNGLDNVCTLPPVPPVCALCLCLYSVSPYDAYGVVSNVSVCPRCSTSLSRLGCFVVNRSCTPAEGVEYVHSIWHISLQHNAHFAALVKAPVEGLLEGGRKTGCLALRAPRGNRLRVR